jgi:hypothetical protein
VFGWYAYDVRDLMPPTWREQMLSVAIEHQRAHLLRPPHITSREDSTVTSIRTRTVSAADVAMHLPWLVRLYQNEFLRLARQTYTEDVVTAQGKNHTIVLNVQHESDSRYECHVDTNPVQGMLYASTFPPGSGGELVVANSSSARGKAEIDAHATRIYPQEGQLILFDARSSPHYVAPLRPGMGYRVAAAMNYYTDSCPESLRPADLDAYLAGPSSFAAAPLVGNETMLPDERCSSGALSTRS